MPDTIVQVANACQLSDKEDYCLSRLLALLYPAHTEYLILEPPQTGSPKLNFLCML